MRREDREIDVFLSSALSDRDLAHQVMRALAEGGLNVVDRADISAGDQGVRKALAESSAVVVVVPQDIELPAWMGVEVGAAIAWQKPIYVVGRSKGQGQLPAFMRRFKFYPLSRLDDVVDEIRRSGRNLSPDERQQLVALYEQHRVPADELLRVPSALQRLVDAFRKLVGRDVPGELLIRELLRLRKAKKLPRLRPPQPAA